MKPAPDGNRDAAETLRRACHPRRPRAPPRRLDRHARAMGRPGHRPDKHQGGAARPLSCRGGQRLAARARAAEARADEDLQVQRRSDGGAGSMALTARDRGPLRRSGDHVAAAAPTLGDQARAATANPGRTTCRRRGTPMATTRCGSRSCRPPPRSSADGRVHRLAALARSGGREDRLAAGRRRKMARSASMPDASGRPPGGAGQRPSSPSPNIWRRTRNRRRSGRRPEPGDAVLIMKPRSPGCSAQRRQS